MPPPTDVRAPQHPRIDRQFDSQTCILTSQLRTCLHSYGCYDNCAAFFWPDSLLFRSIFLLPDLFDFNPRKPLIFIILLIPKMYPFLLFLISLFSQLLESAKFLNVFLIPVQGFNFFSNSNNFLAENFLSLFGLIYCISFFVKVCMENLSFLGIIIKELFS